MARFKNITSDTRYIFFGVPSPRGVLPGSVVEVDDDAAVAYAGQTSIWEADDESAARAAFDATQAASQAAAEAAATLAAAAAIEAAQTTHATDDDAPTEG